MSECQLCGSVNSGMAEICDSCGYSFEGREISNRGRIRAFLVKLARFQNWVDEIKFKKKINEIQIKKYGYSSTYSPTGAWSERKTAELLDEGNTTTSTDIRLAEALDKYPQLMNCKTKSEAKELKREQSSDETIGQILRYMGWVKEHLAGKDGKVEGLIICEVADDRIKYALECIPDIDLKVYCFDNGKLVFKDAQDAYLEALVKKLSPNQLEELIKQLKGET